MYIGTCMSRLEGMCACGVCILLPCFTLCGTVRGDLDSCTSRLINEEIKVRASQSRHKDIRTGMRRPAATSEMLISPFLYFPSLIL